MGERGPVPKRSDRKLGHRTEEELNRVTKAVAVESEPPGADEDWHPVAAQWFEALKMSGQATFYEQSDWATAYLLADSISRELKPQVVGNTEGGEPVWASKPPSGAALSSWLKGMTDLLVTEGARRRAMVELQAQPSSSSEESAVADLNEFRNSLSG